MNFSLKIYKFVRSLKSNQVNLTTDAQILNNYKYIDENENTNNYLNFQLIVKNLIDNII